MHLSSSYSKSEDRRGVSSLEQSLIEIVVIYRISIMAFLFIYTH